MKTGGAGIVVGNGVICAPHGRDAAVASALLHEAGIGSTIMADLASLGQALDDDVSFVVVTQEAILAGDAVPIVGWIKTQPDWSDLPVIILTQQGKGSERNPFVIGILETLGNVTLLERPFHPITFASVARTALKGRQRQYEAKTRLAQLREGEERLRTALQAGHLGSWELDLATQTMWCSDTCKAIFGRDPDKPFTYEELLASVHPEDKTRMRNAVQASMDSGSDYAIEYRHIWPDGGIHWAESRARLVADPSGAVRLVGVSSDISDRKSGEESLRHLNDTLEKRVVARTAELERAHRAVMNEAKNRELAESALQQAQKMEAIGQLTGGVAHDFNNLLTIIRSSADLLRRRTLSEERRRRYVDAISETADRAAKLTGQLLSFARRQALKPEIFDVVDRVRAIADMLKTVLGSRVELLIDVRCDGCFAEADKAQFETALVNLAVNGRDAMDGEGRLTISIERTAHVPAIRAHAEVSGAFVAVSVRDTGKGIAADNIARIFEPFFTTKEVGKGTGLGLSQVFGFTKQSGGEIGVESEIGGGTTFTLYLASAEAPSLPEALPAATPQTDGRGRVLLVEDNVQVGEFATRLLDDLGYETTLALNAKAALEVLATTQARFDIVFSDVVMPGIGGVELARRIRGSWPHLPILLTSGYSHVLVEDARHGFALLHKPYSVEDLSQALKQAIATVIA